MTEMEGAGDLVFTCNDFELLNEKFQNMDAIEQKKKFTDLFFELYIIAFRD